MEKRTRSWLFRLIVAVIVYVFVELSAGVGLAVLSDTKGIRYEPRMNELTEWHRKVLRLILDEKTRRRIDSEIGWVLQEGEYHGDRINARGLRATREYASSPPPGRVRIATFGDSFVYGAEVRDDETWEHFLEELEPKLEILNFGVSGYGLDQAYLRYLRRGEEFHPHVVLIGFLSAQYQRATNTFRSFLAIQAPPLAKPRFLLESGAMRYEPPPLVSMQDYEELLSNETKTLRRIGEHDFRYQTAYDAGPLDSLPSIRLFKLLGTALARRGRDAPFIGSHMNTDSSAYVINVTLLDRFVQSVRERGALPVIVYFPTSWDIDRYRENGSAVYQPIVDHSKAMGHRSVDIIQAFEKYARNERNDKFFYTHHYSPYGNGIVARYVRDYLRDEGLIQP